jgi:L-fuculose-phosphate aldolase
MHFSLLHPRDQLVAIMNRIYRNGMTTLSGGNLSILEENGDMWITPAGVDKGTLLPQDIVCVRGDGTLDGPHRPSSEYPFHRAIYRKRPDLGAVVHAHAPALISFSIARQVPATSIIPQARRSCVPVGCAPYALPGSEKLGENIAETFGDGFNVVLLENHGIATGGPDLLTAFQRLETLDFCARTELKARGLGEVTILTETQLLPFDVQHNLLPEFTPDGHSSRERSLRQQIVKTVHRAVERYLMISTEGTMSARVDGTSFLITPTGIDRGSLEIADLVLIKDGQREQKKLPSRSVRLHSAIYSAHPDINCVITAQSPHILAYAITRGAIDTHVIPESYVLLRDIPIVSYGTQFKDPQQLAFIVSQNHPVALIQNDAVLTTGSTIFQAFDRLEVAESTAKVLLDTTNIGPIVPIAGQQLEDLEHTFF